MDLDIKEKLLQHHLSPPKDFGRKVQTAYKRDMGQPQKIKSISGQRID